MDKPTANEKPRKDWWDKADIVGKWVVAVVIALVGWWIQNVLTTQNTGKDYIGIALGILEKKDLPEDMQKNKGLRQWAVSLLNHYSPEQLDSITTQELINGETRLPPPRISPANNPPGSVYQPAEVLPSVFAFNKDKSLRVSINAEGFLEIIQMTTGQSAGGMHTDISSPKAAAFSPDDHYFVIANDLSFEFFEVDSSGNYSEKGPPRWQNGRPSFYLPSVLEKLTITADDVAVFTGRDGKETKWPLKGQ
jgi:hypothetical protein